jgi:hypothetical protein
MSSVAFSRPFFPSDPALEVFERQDVGARAMPEQDADAFPVDDCPSDEDFARMEAHNERLKLEARYAADVAQLRDDLLIEAVAMVDESPAGRGWTYFMGLMTDAERDAYLAAATAEVLRRIGVTGPTAAAA